MKKAYKMLEKLTSHCNRRFCILLCVITSCLCLVTTIVACVVIFSKDSSTSSKQDSSGKVQESRFFNDECAVEIVESIPVNLTYPDGNVKHSSIYDGWKNLLDLAESSIDIASSYWSLRSSDIHVNESTADQGEYIFSRLLEAGTKRNINIRVVQNIPSSSSPNLDTEDLVKLKAANVQSLNMTKFLGGGILHTKMWLIDGTHFYVGSANMDWRSLTQVKELGVIVYNCSRLANDMQKIFDVYWMMSKPDAIFPKEWPQSFETVYNKLNPMNIFDNKAENSSVYLSSSPPEFCPSGRTSDVDSVISTIEDAEKFVYIAVMDYAPLFIYAKPQSYWSVIDDKLREIVTTKNIEVRLLISEWAHTINETLPFLRSLAALSSADNKISVKLFKVPCVTPEQCQIPYARVNHNKYMVTDKTMYVGTSNWSGDYFVYTGGIGFVLKSNETDKDSLLRKDLKETFERDWNSNHSRNIPI